MRTIPKQEAHRAGLALALIAALRMGWATKNPAALGEQLGTALLICGVAWFIVEVAEQSGAVFQRWGIGFLCIHATTAATAIVRCTIQPGLSVAEFEKAFGRGIYQPLWWVWCQIGPLVVGLAIVAAPVLLLREYWQRTKAGPLPKPREQPQPQSGPPTLRVISGRGPSGKAS